jgi:branched-subunit amino acid aminotransferase/4-amino-4-deoxychorismate lyase
MSAEGALPDFGLIETLRWNRDAGFGLLDLHRARIAASAAALGFPFAPQAFDSALAGAVGGVEDLRVRLVLRGDGGFDVTTAPFVRDPPEKIWRVAVAAQKFVSRDPMLRHKTTRRALYEQALAASGADEVLFLNEKDEVCEGARTNLFLERDGLLLTPPLACGLLPGVLRADLLARGRAREKTLRLADLRENFYLGNSLRGLLRARLSD